MPRKPKPKAVVAKAAASKTGKKANRPITHPPARHRFQRNVRGTILQLLAHAPRTRSELLSIGKFSVSALDMHLKSLKTHGEIAADTSTRPMRFSLAKAEKVIEGTIEPSTGASSGKSLISTRFPNDLHRALDQIGRRFSAPERVEEKLHTLEHLARTLPAAVAEILDAIREDYQKRSS